MTDKFFEYYFKVQPDVDCFLKTYLSDASLRQFRIAIAHKDMESCVTRLNEAWEAAPDVPGIQDEKGFLQVCDLCDGEWEQA